MTIDVAVVGGGVSGLTTAYELRRRGLEVVVLERQARVGGNAVSERIGGFLMEHGPSSVNAAVPAATDLAHSLGLDAMRCELGENVRYRYLVRDGNLSGIAAHPLGFVFSDYLSARARLRCLAEFLIPTKRDANEETVAQFCARRFGREFADRVIDPLVGGLFAGKAGDMSVSAVFPKLVHMERRYGSIVRAVVASRLAGKRMPGRRLYSWHHGIATLPRALADQVGCVVRTGVAVHKILPASEGYLVEARSIGALRARTVVMATQPHVAAMLLEKLDAASADAAAGIDAPPLAVVFLGYGRQQVEHPLDGLGYLTPASEGRALLGALFCSTMFAGRAPADHVAIAGYLGGSRAPEIARLPQADIVALVRSEFRELLGASGPPVVARVRQWPRGLPQYCLGHGRRVADLLGLENRQPGLFVTGNYLTGPSVASCVSQARDTAVRVHQFLAAGAAECPAGQPATAEAAHG